MAGKTSLIIFLCALVIAAATAFADDAGGNKDAKKQFLYQWTDSKGNVHITDSFGKIPEQYREKAQRVESLKQREETSPADDSGGDVGGPAPETGAKAEWQQRIADWRSRLADAEQQYQDLDQERNELLRPWGTIAMAPIEIRLKAEQLEQKMRETQTEIRTAKDMIDNVIPEEARKAGVPPGWLRE